MPEIPERLETALGAMSAGPRNLRAYLEQPGPDFEKASAGEINAIIDQFLSSDPNHAARLRFSHALRGWDNTKEAQWTGGTPRNTEARRVLIHKLLKCDHDLATRIDILLPFYRLEEPLIIALQHTDWYKPVAGVRDYYWNKYIELLRNRRGWPEDSLLNMDNSTRAIVECLSNPEAKESYASRGLVMGYVQSGKTANFTGVVSRAADAGYRLIVVLAGTWNILRNQTQRRFDKDLLGKELLRNDESYSLHHPSDWDEFLEHGGDPDKLGHYTWQRLTRPDIDFKRLKAAIDNLEFEKRDKSLPIYHPTNLHSLPVKLLVVKKHPGILANLVKDLKLIRTNLTDLPTLIIDDESDQAGLNTVDPRKSAKANKDRSKTNLRIVELLKLFPRGQYVGYTATPYANALVDPDDPEDLFPKDFIISLDRPTGYMGVSDFFDPELSYEDLDRNDYAHKEVAYIRRVENALGEDDDDLKKALRSYVLSGALKLYRTTTAPDRYKSSSVKHHTMLIHTSQRKGDHSSLADRLSELWDRCAFNTAAGLNDLEKLWNDDYLNVCTKQGGEVFPANFSDLLPHLSEAIKRIEKGPRVFLVVNSDSPDAPDFSAEPVWKIVVGGNKLSRGYTIEGLTVSYYRRVAGTGDTLMQMGRWFGFRPGYQDLVRVFLGVKEGNKETDLVALFKQVCRMEELFREDVKRYVRRSGTRRITPREVPPMIQVCGDLLPTAKNKMFNAVLSSKNFGGRWSMPTLAPDKSESMKHNLSKLIELLLSAQHLGSQKLGGTCADATDVKMEAVLFDSDTEHLIKFLEGYRWLEPDYKIGERPPEIGLQLEFLKKQKHGIESWLIVAPQRNVSVGDPLEIPGRATLNVKHRQRIDGRVFQVFGEPAHRRIADYLANVEPKKAEAKIKEPNEKTATLRNVHRGICLLYPVRENEGAGLSVGFELLFPTNELPYDLNFTVRRKTDATIVNVATGPEAAHT